MYNDIVDRGTDTCGKRPSKRIREILERWNSTVVTDKFLRYPIQLKGRHTWFDIFGQFRKGCSD